MTALSDAGCPREAEILGSGTPKDDSVVAVGWAIHESPLRGMGRCWPGLWRVAPEGRDPRVAGRPGMTTIIAEVWVPGQTGRSML